MKPDVLSIPGILGFSESMSVAGTWELWLTGDFHIQGHLIQWSCPFLPSSRGELQFFKPAMLHLTTGPLLVLFPLPGIGSSPLLTKGTSSNAPQVTLQENLSCQSH